MKHVEDQDLLLLSHRSLSLFKAVPASFHLQRCRTCSERYASLQSLSTSVAFALRPGLRAWKPSGPALWAKLAILAMMVIGFGTIGGYALASLPSKPPPDGNTFATSKPPPLICKPCIPRKVPAQAKD